jgi:hypothetical protein
MQAWLSGIGVVDIGYEVGIYLRSRKGNMLPIRRLVIIIVALIMNFILE